MTWKSFQGSLRVGGPHHNSVVGAQREAMDDRKCTAEVGDVSAPSHGVHHIQIHHMGKEVSQSFTCSRKKNEKPLSGRRCFLCFNITSS